MSRKARVALGMLGAAVVALIVVLIALYPIRVTYRLWRYRRDPDAVQLFLPSLCADGHDDLPYIYAAFARHGDEPDVAHFRAGVTAELRCIRREEGDDGNEANAYRDLPDEPELVHTIVAAWNQEPDAKIRDDMFVFMSELDFRAWFEIWAGIETGPHPLARIRLEVPSIDPYGDGQAAAHDYKTIRAEWCRIVRPIVLHMLATADDADVAMELARGRCAETDLGLLQDLARHSDGQPRLGAIEGLVEVTDTPERANQTLVPLFAGDCGETQQTLEVWLENKLTAATAAVVATAIARCYRGCSDVDAPACVAQLTEALTKSKR